MSKDTVSQVGEKNSYNKILRSDTWKLMMFHHKKVVSLVFIIHEEKL